jgi:predicted ferric reductase
MGITPFLAQMQARVRHPDTLSVDLFYSSNAPDRAFIDKLQELAIRANVRLHVLVSGRDARLTAERLCQIVPEWASANIWFCGPAGFGRSLRQDLVVCGLAAEDFHQELFDMR